MDSLRGTAPFIGPLRRALLRGAEASRIVAWVHSAPVANSDIKLLETVSSTGVALSQALDDLQGLQASTEPAIQGTSALADRLPGRCKMATARTSALNPSSSTTRSPRSRSLCPRCHGQGGAPFTPSRTSTRRSARLAEVLEYAVFPHHSEQHNHRVPFRRQITGAVVLHVQGKVPGGARRRTPRAGVPGGSEPGLAPTS